MSLVCLIYVHMVETVAQFARDISFFTRSPPNTKYVKNKKDLEFALMCS